MKRTAMGCGKFLSSRLSGKSAYLQKACIGFSYGISFPLTLVILDFWLKDCGISNTVIGLFTFLHLPFTLKFLCGTIIEHHDLPGFLRGADKIRCWIVISHVILIGGVVGMAFSDPGSSLPRLMFFASLTALGDGCKSIVLYPYQIEGMMKDRLGYVAGAVGLGHKIGMITVKVFALHTAHLFGWKTAYLFSALFIFLLMIAVLYMKPPGKNPESEGDGFVHFLNQSIKKNPLVSFGKIIREKEGLRILSVLLLYKSADFMMQKMSKPFLLETGFSKPEIADIVQLFGSVSVIVGGLLGGYFIKKIGVSKAMIGFGVCHAMSFFSYLTLVKFGAVPRILATVIFFEAFTGGCVTVAFLTFLYGICKSGSLYALMWALHEAGGMFFMGISGIIADCMEWGTYFMLVSLMYGAVLLFLARIVFPSTGGTTGEISCP
ncbi:MAG: MFS transporter [Holosporaceae bacterium]|jgi:PAT family beta-lactamase induction signal transducer AmpG|nr:MFS transporter [Holosporaceae bacterium]